mgnify:CR=1 FL=1
MEFEARACLPQPTFAPVRPNGLIFTHPKHCYHMKLHILFLPFLLLPLFLRGQLMLQAGELNFLEGLYQGDLTYKDYTSGELESLPLVASFTRKGDTYTLDIELCEWGKLFDQKYKYRIANGTVYSDGAWNLESKAVNDDAKTFAIVISRTGKDGNERRPCTFRTTLAGSVQQWTITKEVKFDDEPDYFIRNQYTLKQVEKPQPARFSEPGSM